MFRTVINNENFKTISKNAEILSKLNYRINHNFQPFLEPIARLDPIFNNIDYHYINNIIFEFTKSIENKSGLMDDNSGLIGNDLINENLELDDFGRYIDTNLNKPIIKNLNSLNKNFLNNLRKIALPTNRKRISREMMDDVLIQLCTENYISLSVLSGLVNRNPDSLRKNYIKRLVQNNMLSLAYPENKNSPNQAYIAVNKD